MAPPRPYWKGYLKLSLVSCPVALYTATSPGERVAFRQINKKTGNRLRQQLVDEATGDPIDPDDKGRGYEVDKGVYLQVEDEELDAIAIESSHTIDIDSFVPKSEIDERFVDSPYYLIPENKVALEAFAVIRDAMRDKGMVALGRVVLSKRERVIMLQPRGKGLLGATLRYPYEVRDEGTYFDDIGDIQIPTGHACARRAYSREQGGEIRSLQISRSLRGGDRRHAEREEGGLACAQAAADAEDRRRHGFDGGAAPEHREGQRGRAEDGGATDPAGGCGEAGRRGERQARGERQSGPARDAVADRRRRARQGNRRAGQGSARETDGAKVRLTEEGGLERYPSGLN